MTDILKVEGNPDLIREKSSGAIINTSKEKFLSHKKSRESTKILAENVESLEQKMDMILELLKKQ